MTYRDGAETTQQPKSEFEGTLRADIKLVYSVFSGLTKTRMNEERMLGLFRHGRISSSVKYSALLVQELNLMKGPIGHGCENDIHAINYLRTIARVVVEAYSEIGVIEGKGNPYNEVDKRIQHIAAEAQEKAGDPSIEGTKITRDMMAIFNWAILDLLVAFSIAERCGRQPTAEVITGSLQNMRAPFQNQLETLIPGMIDEVAHKTAWRRAAKSKFDTIAAANVITVALIPNLKRTAQLEQELNPVRVLLTANFDAARIEGMLLAEAIVEARLDAGEVVANPCILLER